MMTEEALKESIEKKIQDNKEKLEEVTAVGIIEKRIAVSKSNISDITASYNRATEVMNKLKRELVEASVKLSGLEIALKTVKEVEGK